MVVAEAAAVVLVVAAVVAVAELQVGSSFLVQQVVDFLTKVALLPTSYKPVSEHAADEAEPG